MSIMRNMNNKYFLAWLCVCSLSFLLLVSCASNKPKSEEVVVNEPEPPLEVPPDLFKPEVDSLMAIPALSPSQQKNLFVIDRNNVRVERDGNIRWLVIETSPTNLWAKVETFWYDRGYKINWKDLTLGIMETEWLVDENTGIKKGSTTILLQRNKYRARVERGRNQGTTEIYITHRSQYQTKQGDEIVWKPSQTDRELEIEMLQRMLVYLGLKKSEAKFIIDPSQDSRYVYSIDSKKNRLVINPAPEIEQTWRKLGIALDRGGYLIGKRNLKTSSYEIVMKKPDKTVKLSVVKSENSLLVTLVDSNGKKVNGKTAESIFTAIKANI